MTVSLVFLCLRFFKNNNNDIGFQPQLETGPERAQPMGGFCYTALPTKSTSIKKKFWDRHLSWKSSHLWFHSHCSLQANGGLFLMDSSTRKSLTSLNSLGRADRLHCLGRMEREQNERGGGSSISLSTTSLPCCLKYIFSSTQAESRQSKLMAH